ncbi:UNVERIFIED_CONTAM: hypothetical protein GTU68_021936 [Idotea baltica]|nr:hypothetical protein [Idotea baltica]
MAPPPNESLDVVQILRDDRVNPEGGSYSSTSRPKTESPRSESGSPLNIEGNPTGHKGYVSFHLPQREKYDMKFVANGTASSPNPPGSSGPSSPIPSPSSSWTRSHSLLRKIHRGQELLRLLQQPLHIQLRMLMTHV